MFPALSYLKHTEREMPHACLLTEPNKPLSSSQAALQLIMSMLQAELTNSCGTHLAGVSCSESPSSLSRLRGVAQAGLPPARVTRLSCGGRLADPGSSTSDSSGEPSCGAEAPRISPRLTGNSPACTGRRRASLGLYPRLTARDWQALPQHMLLPSPTMLP